MKRTISNRESEVIRGLAAAKSEHKHKTAYCTANVDVTLGIWNGRHPPQENMTQVVVKKGSTLKIVMISRFGDVGLTNDLDAEHGYHTRVEPDDGSIVDIRWTREELNLNPDHIPGQAFDAMMSEQEDMFP